MREDTVRSAAILREARLRAGYSQDELARVSGKDRTVIARYEQGIVAPSLDALVCAGHEIACVYTQPPRPAGRGKSEQKTAVHHRAEELGMEVRCPKSLKNPEEQARFEETQEGLEAPEVVAVASPLGWPGEDTTLGEETDTGLWSRSRDFDWGD